jgi:hypothetical protein
MCYSSILSTSRRIQEIVSPGFGLRQAASRLKMGSKVSPYIQQKIKIQLIVPQMSLMHCLSEAVIFAR